MGVEGAALATVLAESVTAAAMMWYLLRRSPELRLRDRGSFMPDKTTVSKALRIGLPMGLEHVAICSAQIMVTVIVAPLGVVWAPWVL